jgi:hypothetical protein
MHSVLIIWTFLLALMSLCTKVHSPYSPAKVCKEIDLVTGRNWQPRFEDHTKMPYTEAAVQEILEFKMMNSTGMPQRVIKTPDFRASSFLMDPTHSLKPQMLSPLELFQSLFYFLNNDYHSHQVPTSFPIQNPLILMSPPELKPQGINTTSLTS